MIIVAKSSNKAVSDMLGIDDPYTAFCIDEAACYVSSMPSKPKQNEGKDVLTKMANFFKKQSKRKS
jgi:hypothetical protein